MIYYSLQTGGFYNSKIHGAAIPADAIEITEEHYKELLKGQSAGRIISTDNEGVPLLIDYAPPLDVLKQSKIAEISQAFIDEIKAGFITSSGVKMNADIIDVQRLKSAYDLAALLEQTTLPLVVDYDNTIHATMPMGDVQEIIIELGVHYQTVYAHKQTLRSQALAAATPSDLEQIIWS